MIVTCVHVYVKKEHIADFIEASTQNHIFSVKESGNLRFDLLQSKEDPTKFLFYEAYESEEAAAEHKKTGHYLLWRETVKDWMAKPRQGVPYDVVCPGLRELW